MMVEAIEQIIAYNCLKVDLMLNLQAVESLKKNNPKKIYDCLWSGVF